MGAVPKPPKAPKPPKPPGIFKRIGKALAKPIVWVPLVAILVIAILTVIGWLFFDNWIAGVIGALASLLVVMVAVLVRTLVLRDAEDRLDRGIDEDEAQFEEHASAGALNLDDRFRQAVDDIRGSLLGAAGVQQLPWLLVLGSDGCGKSAAIRESGLQLPTEFTHNVPTGPTQSCDFWLFNEAIVLDTAGRISTSDDENTQSEWQTILRRLRRHRGEVPINGLLICISAAELLAGHFDALAPNLRRRINELEDLLEIEMPVYLVVTKADQIEGFVETTDLLPRERLQEALGWTANYRLQENVGSAAASALAQIATGFESLLAESLVREVDPVRRAKLAHFPQELQAVAAAAARLCDQVFRKSVYGDAPFLRGVYLTSAERRGHTVAQWLTEVGSWSGEAVDPGRHAGGLFLADLLRRVVVGDRDLAVSVRRASPRARLVVHVAAASLLAGLAIWWGYSAFRTGADLRTLAVRNDAITEGRPELPAFSSLRDTIDEQAERTHYWRSAGFGSHQERALRDARTNFVAHFGKAIESPAKLRLVDAVKTQDDRAFEALATLSHDVAWLKSYRDDEAGDDATPEQSEAREGEDTSGAAIAPPDLSGFTRIPNRLAEDLTRSYSSFAAWMTQDDLVERIRFEERALGEASGSLLDLNRLEAHVEKNFDPVRYVDAGFSPEERQREVLPAYTRDAYDGLVSGLIEAMQQGGGDSESAVESFRRGYWRRFDESWRRYLLGANFQARARDEVWNSPYVRLLAQMAENTAVALERDDAPYWMHSLAGFHAQTETEEEPSPPWRRYEGVLRDVEDQISEVADRPEDALALARDLADSGSDPFRKSARQVRELIEDDENPRETRQLRELAEAPIGDGVSFLLERALRELDERYKSAIAAVYSGNLTGSELEELYGKGGALEAFTEEELEPFFAKGRSVPVMGGRTMPLGPEFTRWLESAERTGRILDRGRFSIRIDGIPSQDSDPSLRVFRRELRMICDGEPDEFNYFEGVGRKTFEWTPACDQVVLRVWAQDESGEELELQRRREWKGPMAFQEFLSEARRGQGSELRWKFEYDRPNIAVVVPYKVRGADDLMGLGHREPPQTIRN